MSFKVIDSVSNTTCKALAATDDVVDSAAYAASILKITMAQAHREVLIDSFESANLSIAAATSLTPAQIAFLNSTLPA